MDDGRFDTISRTLASGLSRRQMLRAVGAGSASGILAILGHEASAQECPAATPEANLAVVRRFFEEGVNGGTWMSSMIVAAPDIVYDGATVGDESGLEALKRIYGEALTGFPGIQYSFLTSVASEDAVAVRYAVEGVHSGDFPRPGADRQHHHLESQRLRAGEVRADHRNVGRGESARPAQAVRHPRRQKALPRGWPVRRHIPPPPR